LKLNDFIDKYADNLSSLLKSIDKKAVSEIVKAFEKTSEKGSRIYVKGNGGSCSTASHWANDFAIGLKRRNIANFDMVSLGDNSAVCSAIANDIGYENIYCEQLRNVLKPADVLLAISCSGNSPNIVKAVKYAKEVGATVVGCTGFDGGELMKDSDIVFHIQTEKGEYGLVEDMHLILDHIIYSYYIQKGSDD